ncbi:MAG: BtpA/SgcQ family protein [Candidatus Bipolaricaulota bacterium]|nr:MAG: BtpA/SgcQ family protein [Candidatus Bipolaricaulota bacterium]
MKLFSSGKPLIGVVHLRPLPGAPGDGPGLEAVLERAEEDLVALSEGGADAAIVENFGDSPFAKAAPPETVAAMAIVAHRLRKQSPLPLGINVLRNDGAAALAIAAVAGASFIRVNVFCGAALSDSGWIEGEARRLHRLRRRLSAEIAIFADVHVKHAAHLNSLEEAARDATRNRADALIITGAGTGCPPAGDDLERVKGCSTLPVLVGSGLTEQNVADYRTADGFIVGSALHSADRLDRPLDRERIRRLSELVASLGDA